MSRYKVVMAMFLIIVFLTDCGQTEISDISFEGKNEQEFSEGADTSSGLSQTFYYRCYRENGYYQINNGQIQFVSYDTGKAYAACSRPNCRHNNKSCAAFIDPNCSASGLAEYKGNLYILLYNPENNTYTVRSSSLDGEQQKTIASFSCGDRSTDGWKIRSDISTVEYCADTVWMDISCDYVTNGDIVDRCNQLIGYNLQSGKKTELTGLKRDYGAVSGNPFSFEGITNEYVVYSDNKDNSFTVYNINSTKTEHFNQDIFRSALEKQEIDFSKYAGFQTMYVGYLPDQKKFYFETYCYDTAEDQKEYSNSRCIVFSWDLADGLHILYDFPNGYLMAKPIHINKEIMNGSDVLCVNDQYSKQVTVERLNLITGDRKYLFKDERKITFRILYDGKDFYIGTLNDGAVICRLTKEDYDNGAFSNAEKIGRLGQI